jgi:hypothetical protein
MVGDMGSSPLSPANVASGLVRLRTAEILSSVAVSAFRACESLNASIPCLEDDGGGVRDRWRASGSVGLGDTAKCRADAGFDSVAVPSDIEDEGDGVSTTKSPSKFGELGELLATRPSKAVGSDRGGTAGLEIPPSPNHDEDGVSSFHTDKFDHVLMIRICSGGMLADRYALASVSRLPIPSEKGLSVLPARRKACKTLTHIFPLKETVVRAMSSP